MSLKFPSGFTNCVLLNRLKMSARNWKYFASESAISLGERDVPLILARTAANRTRRGRESAREWDRRTSSRIQVVSRSADSVLRIQRSAADHVNCGAPAPRKNKLLISSLSSWV